MGIAKIFNLKSAAAKLVLSFMSQTSLAAAKLMRGPTRRRTAWPRQS